MYISQVCQKHGHEPDLDTELRFRHIVPYLPFTEDPKGKRVHPVPKAKKDVVGCDFKKMGFTQKKNLLMADEERLFHMEKPFDDEGRRDTKDVKDFNPKTFRILSPDAVFKAPANA